MKNGISGEHNNNRKAQAVYSTLGLLVGETHPSDDVVTLLHSSSLSSALALDPALQGFMTHALPKN